MVKSLKGQFILSILVAFGFIYNSFNYTEFTSEEGFYLPRLLLFIAMIFSVYNAGMLTQKYIQSRKK